MNGAPHIQCRQTTVPNNDTQDGWRRKEGGKKGGREGIHCMDHNEKSWEYGKSSQLHEFERWRGKEYSYCLSCTHVTPTISRIVPEPSSNLQVRETTTIAAVGKLFTTKNWNDEKDMPNHWVQTIKEEGKKRRSCGEIREEHSRETRNHIETRNKRILH